MARKEKRDGEWDVDMEGVESSGGGGGFHIPEGKYKVKVKSIEKTVSKNDNDQFKWIFTGVEGKAKNKDFYYYTTLNAESLWKLKQTLEALGVDVPNSVMKVKRDEVVGLICLGDVIDDEYNNETRSKLQRVETADDDDEEEDKPAAKASKAKDNGKKKTVVKLDADEVKGMTEDELEELIETHELDVDLADHKTLRRKSAAVVAALEESDLIGA